jgi:hypothetical protein
MIIRSEFAAVEVREDTASAGPTLVIRDLEFGTEIRLDAMELAALTRVSHDDFVRWVRPE